MRVILAQNMTLSGWGVGFFKKKIWTESIEIDCLFFFFFSESDSIKLHPKRLFEA